MTLRKGAGQFTEPTVTDPGPPGRRGGGAPPAAARCRGEPRERGEGGMDDCIIGH